ncbi:hypothetical protein [Streptomyces canus]|uniref:hypothetical protein n=1 Tax=Streptomyces canus TaxID=58343 RepID=UPI00382D686C
MEDLPEFDRPILDHGIILALKAIREASGCTLREAICPAAVLATVLKLVESAGAGQGPDQLPRSAVVPCA